VMTHKYNLTCPECGGTTRSNTNRGYICGKCSKEGKRIPLTVSENILKITVW
jgi:tRNA(Ile2) C34 agmatinyltransferase TiaS